MPIQALNMPWLLLILAGLLETAWVIGLKLSDGFSKPWPSLCAIVCMAGSLWLLACATRTIPVGTAYVVWTGTGAIGAAIVGMVFFGEPRTIARIVCILLIASGVVGLKLLSTTHKEERKPFSKEELPSSRNQKNL